MGYDAVLLEQNALPTYAHDVFTVSNFTQNFEEACFFETLVIMQYGVIAILTFCVMRAAWIVRS